jgi:hypothetical protein
MDRAHAGTAAVNSEDLTSKTGEAGGLMSGFGESGRESGHSESAALDPKRHSILRGLLPRKMTVGPIPSVAKLCCNRPIVISSAQTLSRHAIYFRRSSDRTA